MKINKYLNVLQTIKLFRGLTDGDILNYFENADYHISTYKKGSIIALDGEICNSWDIIVSGGITIQRINPDGNILTMVDFSTGDTLGGNLIFSSTPIYPMTLIALQDVTLIRISKQLILDLCLNNETNLVNFLEIISVKTQILTNRFKSVVHKTLRECIIDYIKLQYHLQKNLTITLDMTKKELAQRFGVQRTSLSRELSKMKRDGLIEYNSKEIKIIDTSFISI